MVRQWSSDGQMTMVRRWLIIVNLSRGYKMVLINGRMMDQPWLQRTWLHDGQSLVTNFPVAEFGQDIFL